MKIVDRQNPQKLYLQLVRILQESIERGELAVGNRLPTEEEICRQQGISKAVVRAATQELARKGLVRKIAGKGTFVQKPVSADGVRLWLKITENMLDYGVAWETEVIQKMSTVPPSDLKEFFGAESGNQVFKVIRIRKIKDEPVMLETSYVSQDLCPGLALEDLRSSSLIEIIHKKYSIPLTRCADSIEITTLEKREASLLKKKEDDSALLADRILYTTNDRVVAFIRYISIATHHRLTYESIRA